MNNLKSPHVVVSAPGKVILHGEHAVVYGKLAVAASINLRTRVRLEVTSSNRFEICFPVIDVSNQWSLKDLQGLLQIVKGDAVKTEFLTEKQIAEIYSIAGVKNSQHSDHLAIVSALVLYAGITASNGQLPSLRINVDSQLPCGAGLGSSAAFSVGLSTAFLGLTGKIVLPGSGGDHNPSTDDLDLINQWAFVAEKVIHGKPSGIDNSVCTFGGIHAYKQGSINRIDSNFTADMLLVNTKVSRNTKQLVMKVLEKKDKVPKVINPILEAMDQISNTWQETIAKLGGPSENEAVSVLELLVDLNQGLLTTLGVGHPKVDEICHIAKTHGLAAKLTGAGGGGCAYMVIYKGTPEEVVTSVKACLEKCGYECWLTSLGGKGVIIHSI